MTSLGKAVVLVFACLFTLASDLKAIKNVDGKRDPDGGMPLVRIDLDDDTGAWPANVFIVGYR